MIKCQQNNNKEKEDKKNQKLVHVQRTLNGNNVKHNKLEQ